MGTHNLVGDVIVLLNGVILAAGLGKRMNSSRHKVVHEVCGKPMILHIVEEMAAVGFDRLFVVVGKLESQVRDVLGDRVTYLHQAEQLGTGHAVMSAAPELLEEGMTVVLYGDGPLISHAEVERMIELAKREKANAVLTAVVDDPFGFGRIIRDNAGHVERIVEEKDATLDERAIREVNSGIFAFDTAALKRSLSKLTNDNAQQEYLLTDCVEHLRSEGQTVIPVVVSDVDEIANVNDRIQLAYVEERLRRRILKRHMANGVTVIDPASTYIHADVTIDRDTVIYPGTHLEGKTTVARGCTLGPNVRLIDVTVDDDATITYSVAMQSSIGERATVGPFAYIRPHSVVGEDAKVGDFVELKNATLGSRSKVSHLAYVGDASVGSDVNIGCGVVTVNYDGFQKHQTVIEDESFIGSNVNLIAPVHIGRGGYVATGSTITEDVEMDDFAIARERQVNKKGYARVLRARLATRYTERNEVLEDK
ncbi:bifunctional UDP-N-acetylglucosamine diphosphorylase/glucosamine-1-phosphate N-acetyltransferase GlmU [Ferroacidibacillus organovorans]|nr:bifunctional UDP-N-acetylglucosamine diphosphorylase/glucosamine-1-phosphate N-acetyltransferase GlmU [Ferroacidibacillus organovorans]